MLQSKGPKDLSQKRDPKHPPSYTYIWILSFTIYVFVLVCMSMWAHISEGHVTAICMLPVLPYHS